MAAGELEITPTPVMALGELLGSDNPALMDTLIEDIALDSRQAGSGCLFLAMPGDAHDGRHFIEQAVANGCAAVVAEPPVAGFVEDIAVPLIELPDLREEAGHLAARFFGYPSRAIHTIGTTGTNGKTTTSQLIAQLTRASGQTCGVIGTLGCTLGDEVVEAANTTPDALAVQRQLASWKAAGVDTVSMEVSSHALVQGRVNGVEFATAIFTNLSHDHLDYHGSMASYGRAKLRLFAGEQLRHAVINTDDDFAPLVAAAVPTSVERLMYSASGADADVRATEIAYTTHGVSCVLETPWGSEPLRSPLIGDFNLANLAAAIAACVLSGQELSSVVHAAASLVPVAGRMQHIDSESGVEVIVDFAHTPDALAQVLASLRPQVDGKLVTVFGCGGDRDQEKRQLMGRIACSLADHVMVTSDNPRSEDPEAIIADVVTGCSGSYAVQVDRALAIAQAIAEANPGDCIVIAGKGHEQYQLVEGEKRFFSDVAEATQALAARSST